MLKPEDVNLVIAHGGCPDGFGAAWSAWTMHKDNIEYHFVGYGNEYIPDVDGKNVLIVDFSYKTPEIMNEINARANSMLLLDHHKSARDALEGKIDCDHIFDMNRSGARMAWDYFHPNEIPPHLILYVEDRDIWKWKYPDSRPFLANLDSYEYDFKTWDKFSKLSPVSSNSSVILVPKYSKSAYEEFLNEGYAIMRSQQKMVDAAVKKAVPGWIKTPDGEKYLAFAVNCTSKELISDVGHKLSKENIMALAWGYSHSRDLNFCSLRSVGDTDVSLVASKFGGGGHKNASGFEFRGDIKEVFELLPPEMEDLPIYNQE